MKEVRDLDVVVATLIDNIPKSITQAQYPTMDQIFVLMELARKLKMYDAFDLLHRTFIQPSGRKM